MQARKLVKAAALTLALSGAAYAAEARYQMATTQGQVFRMDLQTGRAWTVAEVHDADGTRHLVWFEVQEPPKIHRPAAEKK